MPGCRVYLKEVSCNRFFVQKCFQEETEYCAAHPTTVSPFGC